ncbi:MAG TPA: hypothetical protein VK485_03225 [Sphingomicrobium sp.]|nr:hypothetical protein [Sphingomicrobium sp.]
MPIAHSPLVERIARVLAGLAMSKNANGDDASVSGDVDLCWPDFREDAIAVLRELREPDSEMAQAGDAATWQKMVHAALDQK